MTKQFLKKPELLIPGGDLEKLKTAVRFGADAVYVGAGAYSLRAKQTAFTIKELKQGVLFAHKNNVKVYLAMNIFAFDEDLSKMKNYLKKAIKTGIDAIIISDPSLIKIIRALSKKINIHLSTQANTLNSYAVDFWRHQGIKRIVLGRELSLKQISKIRKNVRNIELEVFIHGAMCMAYSGRCLLSKYMTNRSANRGECSHPCRWEYILKEPNRPKEDYTIEQDKRTTYIMNSKDLCMIEQLPRLIQSGVNSFKIEGRMKSSYYVAIVTKIYRKAIDTYMANPKKYKYNPIWKEELEKISHRKYSTGFFFGIKEKENKETSAYTANYTFVGIVKTHHTNKNELEIKGRNYFAQNDTLEIIDPEKDEIIKFKVLKIRTNKNKTIDKAHNGYHVFVGA
ncbi:hypothetical protein A2246_06185, partial [candidate division WOR-1 bacterium RIFOXYA2_FULL_37_7]